MRFEEVINALRSGQKIRCKEWGNKNYYITKDKYALIDIYTICFGKWEIVPEKVKSKLVKPILAETERTILAGLQAMGYKWIVHNENEEYDVAFTKKPYKYKSSKGIAWCINDFLDLNFIKTMNLNIAKCLDKEPLSIDWLLESE